MGRTTFEKLFRISLSAAGVGVSAGLMRGIRVGRDSRGRLYVSVAIGPMRGRWFLPAMVLKSATAETEKPPSEIPKGAVQPVSFSPMLRPATRKVSRTDDGVYRGLRGLGYSVAEITDVWEQIPAPDEATLEERLRQALIVIARRDR